MRTSAILAAFALPFVLAAQQPMNEDWRFAHPDATLVGSIRPQEILNSPLIAEALAGAQKDPNSMAMLGMARGLLSGITEIRFSLLDTGTPEPEIIALVSGQFDDGLVSMMAQDRASAKRINANTLLLGNGKSLERAVLRMNQTAPVLQSHALAGIEALAAYDLWLSGKLPDMPITAGLKLNLRGLALGVSVRDMVEMQLAMETATPAMAESLIKTARAAESAQPTQFRGLLQSPVDGTVARFRINIPQEVALDALHTRTAATLSASTEPAPLPPPHRNSIVIQGLDDGPREIPLK